MRILVTLSLCLGILASTGCKSSCRVLSEKLCDCSLNTVAKDECLQAAQRSESAYPPSEADEAVCEPLIERCDCNQIDTPEGKKNCGLANP